MWAAGMRFRGEPMAIVGCLVLSAIAISPDRRTKGWSDLAVLGL